MTMRFNCQTRLCALLIHFSLSLTIFSLLLYVLLTLWYPAPFFSASGGLQGIKIAALVDLVLGPALTFVVYNRKKSARELRTDLSLIIFMQLTALFWGANTIYQQRPVAAVFWESEFYTVPAAALEEQGISVESLQQFSDQYPAYIYAEKPETPEQWKPVLDKIKNQNLPPHHQIELYRPLHDHMQDIYQHALDIDEITSRNAKIKSRLQQLLADTGSRQYENKYIGMASKYQNIILVFNNDRMIAAISVPLNDRH